MLNIISSPVTKNITPRIVNSQVNRCDKTGKPFNQLFELQLSEVFTKKMIVYAKIKLNVTKLSAKILVV